MIKNEKKVTVNFLYQLTYQLLLVIMPLITAPYISRVLGATNTGIYSYTYAVAAYFMMFSSLGIDIYGNRCIAKCDDRNHKELNEVFSGILFAHLISAIIVIIAYCAYVFLFKSKYKEIALLQGLWILSTTFDISWFFFGLEKFKITVTRNFIIKITSVLLVFLLVRTADDLWIYTLIMAGSAFFSQLILWCFVFKYIEICKVPFYKIIEHFKSIASLFIAVAATSVYLMIDKVMLGWNKDMAILGSYEYADKILRIVVSLITALGTVMLPRMTSLYSRYEKEKAKFYLQMSSKFLFIMTCALGFGLAGIAKVFIPLFLGDEYVSAILIVKILCVAIPVMGWNNFVRTQILMPNMKDKVYTIAVWAGAIIDVLLNIILIPIFSAYGAAVATVITYVTVGFFQTIPVLKEFPIRNCLKNFFPSLVIGGIMFLVVRKIGELNISSFKLLILQILAGIIIYVPLQILYMFLSNDDILKYVRNLKR